eukprot:TRINITY_DN8613_c0_g1_i1.p1 TRINITY_DN8613_c0_g1~~TRINITY_DN8613_c0_g1_i1.p1  ORF type:complete len:758 (-),score=221.56 TRINITY_DN8613_c0_g1_i1:23-2296(-)
MVKLTIKPAYASTEHFELDLALSSSVAELRKKVSQLSNVPLADLRLVFRGKILDDDALSLCNVHAQNNSVIMLIKKPAGTALSDGKEVADLQNEEAEDRKKYEGALLAEESNHLKTELGNAIVATTMLNSGALKVVCELESGQEKTTLDVQIPYKCDWRLAATWWFVIPRGDASKELEVQEEDGKKKVHVNLQFVWPEGVPLPHDKEKFVALHLATVFQVADAEVCWRKEGKTKHTACFELDLEVPPEDEKSFVTVGKLNGMKCMICRKDGDDNLLLLCDECDNAAHTYCVNLDAVPAGDWYCPKCKNSRKVAKAAMTKKQAKMPSATATKKWGGGVSCAGRAKAPVDKEHWGPIPSVQVGQHFRYQINLSEEGVHIPLIAGIHGGKDGCRSLVLAGGYPEDEDAGDLVIYTGSGGRDLKLGNRRNAPQTFDQVLTKGNLAISKCCVAHKNCPNCKARAKACEACRNRWREAKPIRVVRSYKLAKTDHNKFAPKKGYRYDGIYKCVDYWFEKGKSGFQVVRFELQRDDPAPAPWTEEGMRIVKELQLDKLPEVDKAKDNSKDKEKKTKKEKSKSRKRKHDSDEDGNAESSTGGDSSGSDKTKESSKKKQKSNTGEAKVVESSPKPEKEETSKDENPVKWATEQFAKLEVNHAPNCEPHELVFTKAFKEVLAQPELTGPQMYKQLEEGVLNCVICCEMLKDPVTVPCGHSFCKDCLERMNQNKVGVCPTCRGKLAAEGTTPKNEFLEGVIRKLFGHAR